MNEIMAHKEPWTTDTAINDFLETLELPPEPVVKQYMAERAPLEAAAPAEGSQAPDFSLERLTPEGQRSGEFVSLADFCGRPLALLFGNYTCPIYRGQLASFAAAHAEFGERIAFLVVYIKEEHPEDGWQLDINRDQCVVYYQPNTADERAAVAADLMRKHKFIIPTVMDGMDNAVCDLYAGSPERLYILDENGTVLHRSPPGPFDMSTVNAWRAALARV
jgi:hypothetical protein